MSDLERRYGLAVKQFCVNWMYEEFGSDTAYTFVRVRCLNEQRRPFSIRNDLPFQNLGATTMNKFYVVRAIAAPQSSAIVERESRSNSFKTLAEAAAAALEWAARHSRSYTVFEVTESGTAATAHDAAWIPAAE